MNAPVWVELSASSLVVVTMSLRLLQPYLAGRLLHARLTEIGRALDEQPASPVVTALQDLIGEVMRDPRSGMAALARMPGLGPDAPSLEPLARGIHRAVSDHAVDSTYRSATEARRLKQLAAIPVPTLVASQSRIDLRPERVDLSEVARRAGSPAGHTAERPARAASTGADGGRLRPEPGTGTDPASRPDDRRLRM